MMDNLSEVKRLRQSNLIKQRRAGISALSTICVQNQHQCRLYQHQCLLDQHQCRLQRNVTRSANGLQNLTVAKNRMRTKNLTEMLVARFQYQLAKVQQDFATVMGIRNSLIMVMTSILTALTFRNTGTLSASAKQTSRVLSSVAPPPPPPPQLPPQPAVQAAQRPP